MRNADYEAIAKRFVAENVWWWTGDELIELSNKLYAEGCARKQRELKEVKR